MEDITEILNDYRECSRHIWNTYFRFLEEGDSLFWSVEEALLNQLVLSQINKPPVCLMTTSGNKEPILYLRIIPTSDCGSPAMINRTGDSGYWDDPVNMIKPEEIDLRFLEFFDFAGPQDYRDWKYYRARIQSFPTQKHLEGRDLLIDASYINVIFTGE